MTVAIIITAIILILCVFSSKFLHRFGVPTLLIFILLGMVFGSDGIVGIYFDNYGLAETICSVALIFIMFYGGFGTNWNTARPVLKQSICMSTLGVIFTALLTGLFCHYALGMSWLEGLLTGSVVGSTDAASVFSILRSKKLNLKGGLASLLEIESGSNDPVSYMMTIIILTIMSVSSDISLPWMIAKQLLFGFGIGFGVAFLSSKLLSRINFEINGMDAILVIGTALFTYGFSSWLGGNGYLSVYIVGIVLGNSKILHKTSLVHFFDGITSLMQLMVFFLLGLLCTPSRMLSVALPALLIAVFLTFLARPVVVALLLTPFRAKLPQQLLVSWAGLRGATSAIFALTAAASGAVLQYDLFHLVFCIVLFSIALQGTLLPLVARKLGMIDESSDILKTFTDYTEHREMQLMRLLMEPGNPWIGCAVRDLTLPPDTMLVSVLRQKETIIPRGNTVLLAGDTAVLAAGNDSGSKLSVPLCELKITADHAWNGKTPAQLHLPADELIILIRRGSETLIPQGDTTICAGDTLVMHDAS